MSGNQNSGTNRDLNYDRSLSLYLKGYSFKKIAKSLKISRNKVARWARENSWNNLLAQQQSSTEQPNSFQSVAAEIRKRVEEGFRSDDLKPANWKQLMDALALLDKMQP